MKLLTLLLVLLLPVQSLAVDHWEARKNHAEANGKFIDHLVVNRITVLAENGKEAITFIQEDNTTYPMIRWLDRAKNFLFGMVAHEKKNSGGTIKTDNHFSMYIGKPDGSRDGVFDLEFNEAEPMLSLQRLALRSVDGTYLTVISPNNKRFKILVDDNGNLSAERIYMRADSVTEE